MAGLEAYFAAALAVLLASLRALTAFAVTPVLAAYGVPITARILLALVIGASASATMNVGEVLVAGKQVWEPAGLMTLAFGEILWGALLGVGAHAAVAAFAIAGRLIDMQSGLSIGAAFDPVTRAQAGVISQIMTAVAVVLFFASDAHLALIELIASSYHVFPIGSLPTPDSLLQLALDCGLMFVIGFTIVAPITMALLMTELLVGVSSRNMPQINVLIVALPLKLWVTIAMLVLTAHTWANVVRHIISDAVVLGG